MPKMRKYQQLLLVFTSAVSVLLLLIYRHEYLRLHYVLEVLNFFGTPPKKLDLVLQKTIEDWQPAPYWQRIDENFYSYSAFYGNGEVKILGFGTSAATVKMSCNLWFENNQKPVLGRFTYTVLTQGKHYTNYIFGCKQRHSSYNVPFAVSLRNSPSILIRETLKDKKLFDLTVCVVPTETVLNTSNIIDFIAHNHILGADNFIFYTSKIPQYLINSLKRVSTSINFAVTNFPWNLNSNMDEKNVHEIITHDCVMRTALQTKFVMTIALNEFVIPKFSVSMLNVLETSEKANRYTLSVVNFCLNVMPQRNILQNTRYIQPPSEEPEEFLIHANAVRNHSDIPARLTLETDVVMLYRYITCPDIETYSDSAALNFVQLINNAQLRILFDAGEL